MNAYIHFPLMLAGLECVFEKKHAGWLTAAVALAALNGFYMLYCESVLLLICAVIRYYTRGEKTLGFFSAAGRAIGYYALGIGLAAVVFVPVTIGFLNGQRLSGAFNTSGVRVLYALKEYCTIPMSMLIAHGIGTIQPMLAVGAVGLMPMLFDSKERSARGFALIGLLAALTPLTGWALNGFNYETTRWNFALSLLAAMLGVRAVSYAQTLENKRVNAICALLAAYPIALLAAGYSRVRWAAAGVFLILAAFAAIRFRRNRRDSLFAALWLLFSAFTALCASDTRKILILLMLLLIAASWLVLRLKGRWGRILIAVLCAAQICVNCLDVWSNRADEMVKLGESEAMYETSTVNDLSEFPRTDASLSAISPLLNVSAWSHTAGTSVYNSTISGNVFRFMSEIGNAGVIQINSICGVDSRAALETIWSVGRYLGDCVPYGFEESENGVYENGYALPIGYAYTSSVSKETYDALSPLEKQWALLQCAVLEDSDGGSVNQSLYDVAIDRIEWENVTADGETLTVGEDACIRLTFDAPADCELYLTMQSLEYHGTEIELGNYVSFTCGAGENKIHLMPQEGSLTLTNRDQIIVNLGYDSEARTTAEIRFARTGEYRLGTMTLTAQPMADYESMVTALREHGLQNVQIENDCITGEISLEEDGTLVYAIPYSAGWHATVDGKAVQTVSSAGCMLAVPISAGEHEIVITYTTPGLYIGLAITLAAFITAIAVFRRRK